ncbi:hypothetical protein BT93_E0925 [Corymbia citriodora subsp. variegata]|nr:hypothetical protein BT93_E0925 [Corymbia citriodora subsp. variegata]
MPKGCIPSPILKETHRSTLKPVTFEDRSSTRSLKMLSGHSLGGTCTGQPVVESAKTLSLRRHRHWQSLCFDTFNSIL